MTPKLRLVVFTGGDLTPINRVFFERLASDPLLDLVAIIVDGYRPRRKPLFTRIARALREDGLGWIRFKIEEKLRAFGDRISRAAENRIHGKPAPGAPDLPIHYVPDIHNALELIRSFSPDLGVIVGGRILRHSVISIPTHGTLNIHKRRLPDYRGGGPVGYWEVLAGETSIGVSIHYAIAPVDAGPVLGEATIPIEEYDTLESLKLKADLKGAQLYHETIQRFAEGHRAGVVQDLSRGITYRAPSDCKVWRLQRRLERKKAAAEAGAPHLLVQLRVLMQYVVMLPRLLAVKRALIRERRAPISIFFYHLVADSALNHMCLPLPAFVRQIEFLRRHYAILSLDEAVERLRRGSNDEIAASITFDDGYRDNAWAIEYLRYFDIPATFFVSIGHVRDGSSFEHDRKRGYMDARPMSIVDVRALASAGFIVGSHGVHHEDFGALATADADRSLLESRQLIEDVTGSTPTLFAFPKGQRGTNITADSLALALKRYSHVFSAYGGYSYPQVGRRHFLRMSNPASVFELGLLMSGYTGFRQCLAGNAWGLETEKLDPCSTSPRPSIALVAASAQIVGGHSVQAQALETELQRSGFDVDYIPIDARFPRDLRWARRVPYLRTALNEALYLPSLLRIARADLVHIFSASYWSFLLAPAPAILMAKLLGKPVVLHYHSGEADDHLTHWRRSVIPTLRFVDEIVVPSPYLQRVFATHGYRARVIHNIVDPSRFRRRERSSLRPRLLSVRNLEAYYDVENTVAAFALVKERFPDATLTIVGSGSEEQRLRQLACRDVRFLGLINPAELPAIYDEADIFVNSSVLDNQPVSILEAFAAGLPIVSTPTGDIASMLRGGEAGLLVEPRDPSAMAAACIRLLEEPGLALQLTRCAQQQLDQYAWRSIGEQWKNVYAGVLTETITNAVSLATDV